MYFKVLCDALISYIPIHFAFLTKFHPHIQFFTLPFGYRESQVVTGRNLTASVFPLSTLFLETNYVPSQIFVTAMVNWLTAVQNKNPKETNVS